MTKRRCDTCEYWRMTGTNNQGEPEYGECRARSPDNGGEWPVTSADDWCGEWEQKETDDD